MSNFKPFHESIVEAINDAPDVAALNTLGALILGTKIPKNHDAIIEAWEQRAEALRYNNPVIPMAIREQAQAAPVS